MSAILVLALPQHALAEWDLAGFVGAAHTQNSTLHISQPAQQTDVRLDDVRWAGNSFESPLYYGVRGGYFFRRRLGVAAEFIHLKVFADTQRSVLAQGTLQGAPVNAVLPMNTVVQRFSISHGDNLLLGSIVVRQDFWRGASDKLGRVIVSGRVGAGGTIPHAESTILGHADEHYQGGSAAEQAAGGIEFRLARHVYALGEYKLTHNHQHVSVVGGTADTVLWSHHGVFGVAVHF